LAKRRGHFVTHFTEKHHALLILKDDLERIKAAGHTCWKST